MNYTEFQGHDRALRKTDQCGVRLQNLEAILGMPHQGMQGRYGLGNARCPIFLGHPAY